MPIRLYSCRLNMISFRFFFLIFKFPYHSLLVRHAFGRVCVHGRLCEHDFFSPFESWGWILNKYFVQFAYCVCRSFLTMKTHQRLRCISHRKIIFVLKVWTEFWSSFFFSARLCVLNRICVYFDSFCEFLKLLSGRIGEWDVGIVHEFGFHVSWPPMIITFHEFSIMHHARWYSS